ncbi:c-Myc-binding protein-like isoform X1 [Selaginella moellendorffii]|uniref:c-Myc-binding protein-like isoform X1 n=1 Tax=Selaginella moellendorffii TaxID=88036 RepID=UPI000D1C5B48|nr:c-Myc-binding protein-like isoform X1 [Selaginella moellendorffii]|eukprot:XP_024527575.1 c-Myc-binding protein-like isoform X1 [Selaginella moellendorffii]
MTSESKKEAFRKYLEASGVLDSLTKVLVALYEENDKPPLAIDFIQHNLGGYTNEEYTKLKGERDELQLKYNELVAAHEELGRKFEELQLQLPPPEEAPPVGEAPPA